MASVRFSDRPSYSSLPQRVDFGDAVRIWLHLPPKHLSQSWYQTILDRQAVISVWAFTTLSCFAFIGTLIMVVILRDYPSWRADCWLWTHAFEYCLIAVNILRFQLKLRQGRLRHQHMFYELIPTTILAGLLWGSLPWVIGASNIPLYYIAFAVSSIYPLCGYCWTYGFWILGHAFSLTTLITISILDIVYNEAGNGTFAYYTTLYIALLAVITLLACWGVTSANLGQLQVEEQNEVIQLFLREFEEGAQDWIWQCDADYYFINVSERMEEAFGRVRQSGSVQRINELFPQDSPDTQLLWNRLRNRKPFANVEVCLSHDKSVWWSISGKPLYGPHDEFVGYRGIGTDISDARKVSEAETSKRRHDAIVQMAGSIAHDFNNILSAVMTCLELIQMTANDDDEVQRFAESALESCDRGHNITSQLVSFAGQDFALDPHVFEGRQEIQKIIDGVAAKAPLGVQIQLHEGERHRLYVDRLQFDRAVCNLLENAVNAISTRRESHSGDQMESGKILLSFSSGTDGLAKITVDDNGPGIPPEAMPKLFDPFFTTRRHCGGSGLGLSMVHGFAVQCGGKLSAMNGPNGGARIVLELPLASYSAAQEAVTSKTDSITNPTEMTLEGKTLFLLEDDVNLAKGILELLESTGIHAVHADSIESARAQFDNQSENYDCVLSDVMLPDGRGFDFVLHVRNQDPHIPIVYMSGYSDTLPSDTLSSVKATFLPKPFRLQELIDVISREVYRR